MKVVYYTSTAFTIICVTVVPRFWAPIWLGADI